MGILLPVLAIELDDAEFWREGLEAIDIDIDTIGVGARGVEGLDPADLAEGVSSHTTVERVGCELVLAGKLLEPRQGHNHMQVA